MIFFNSSKIKKKETFSLTINETIVLIFDHAENFVHRYSIYFSTVFTIIHFFNFPKIQKKIFSLIINKTKSNWFAILSPLTIIGPFCD